MISNWALAATVAHVVDPAVVLVVDAVALQTIVGEADHARAQVAGEEKGQLVDVAALGLAQPLPQVADLFLLLVVERDLALGLILLRPFVGADVVAAPLDHHRLDGLAQDLAQEGHVLVVQLALERLVGGGHHHGLAREQRRDQVGDGLAGAGGRLDERVLAGQDRLLDRLGHGQLGGAQFVAGQLAASGPLTPKSAGRSLSASFLDWAARPFARFGGKGIVGIDGVLGEGVVAADIFIAEVVAAKAVVSFFVGNFVVHVSHSAGLGDG